MLLSIIFACLICTQYYKTKQKQLTTNTKKTAKAITFLIAPEKMPIFRNMKQLCKQNY